MSVPARRARRTRCLVVAILGVGSLLAGTARPAQAQGADAVWVATAQGLVKRAAADATPITGIVR